MVTVMKVKLGEKKEGEKGFERGKGEDITRQKGEKLNKCKGRKKTII
jgi:hypothetical protein